MFIGYIIPLQAVITTLGEITNIPSCLRFPCMQSRCGGHLHSLVLACGCARLSVTGVVS